MCEHVYVSVCVCVCVWKEERQVDKLYDENLC
jgi:hypothetical protein